MKNERDKFYIMHILESISRIEEYTKGVNSKKFYRKHLVQDGVIRQLEIIGEASKNLSNELRDKYNTMPWKDIIGMRNKLTHEYFGVDLFAVWTTIKNDIPQLKTLIQNILSD